MPRACGPSKPIFATTPYEADECGVLRAVLPARCAFASAAERCSLVVDHLRPRKTGPRFPLAVVSCSVHRRGRYTLYPPGHFPYGREPVVPCSASGALLRDAATGEPPWEATLFAAALDAAGGGRWSADSPAGDRRRRRTQGRRLELAGRLLGVDRGLEGGTRERIATRLGVATMTLLAAAGGWGRSWTMRSAAVLAVLSVVPVDGALLDRMLAAGAVNGLWAEPQGWDAARGSWIMLRSGRLESPDVRPPRGRSPPPTNSHGAVTARADLPSES